MSAVLFANNAISALAAPLSPLATSLTVAAGTGSLYPSPTGGSYFVLTLASAANNLVAEIVHVTARAGDAMTIVRAQEGTTALSWATGDSAANYWTAGQAAAIGVTGRELLVPMGEPGLLLPGIATRSNLFFAFDADGNAVALPGSSSGVPQLPLADFDGATDLYTAFMDSLSTYGTAILPPLEPGAFGLIGTQVRVADLQSICAAVPFSCPLKMKDAFGAASMILNATTNPADVAHMDRIVLSGLRLLGNYTNQTGTPGTGTSCLVELRAVKNSVIDIIGEDAFSDVIYWGPATSNPALVGQNNIWRVRGKNYAGRNTATIIALQGGRGEVYPEGFQLHGLDVEANATANITQGVDLLVVGGNGGGGYGAGNSYLCATAGIAPMSDLNVTIISTGGITGGLFAYRNAPRLRATVQGGGFTQNGIVGTNGGSLVCSGKISGNIAVPAGAGNGFIDLTGNSLVDTELEIDQAANATGFIIEFGGASRHVNTRVTVTAAGPQIGIELAGCVGVEMDKPYVKGAFQSFVFDSQSGTPTMDCVLRDPVSDSAVSVALNEAAGGDRNTAYNLKQMGAARSITVRGGGSTVTGSPLKGATTWAPSATAGSSTSTTLTVAGLVNGQSYQFAVLFPVAAGLAGATLSAYCSADNTATVVLSNLTGLTVTLASTALTVIATPTY